MEIIGERACLLSNYLLLVAVVPQYKIVSWNLMKKLFNPMFEFYLIEELCPSADPFFKKRGKNVSEVWETWQHHTIILLPQAAYHRLVSSLLPVYSVLLLIKELIVFLLYQASGVMCAFFILKL